MVRELPGAAEVRAEMEREAAEQAGEIVATPETASEPVLEMEAPQEWTDSRPPPAKGGFFSWLGSLFRGGS